MKKIVNYRDSSVQGRFFSVHDCSTDCFSYQEQTVYTKKASFAEFPRTTHVVQSQASAFTDCLITIEPDECSEEVRCFCNLDDNLLDNDLYHKLFNNYFFKHDGELSLKDFGDKFKTPSILPK